MQINKPSDSMVATVKSKIPTVGIGFVNGIGNINNIVNKEIQNPLIRQIKGLWAIFANRGRVILCKILVRRPKFCKRNWAKDSGKTSQILQKELGEGTRKFVVSDFFG